MTTTSYPETLPYPEELPIGETFTTPTWRVHRFSTSVRATHLLNAGKRGKRCAEFAVWIQHGDETILADIGLRIACLAVDGIGPDEMAVEIEIGAASCGGAVEQHTRRGVDVAPGCFHPVRIDGAHVRVVANYSGDWSVIDTDDTNNEPTLIPLKSKDRKAFYAWAKVNAEALKMWRFPEVMSAMRLAGIGYHYYCAVD